MIKFGFSEKATKFEKIFVVLLTRLSCSVRATVLCAQQRTCQKVDEDFLKKMWTSRIIQTLIYKPQAIESKFKSPSEI